MEKVIDGFMFVGHGKFVTLDGTLNPCGLPWKNLNLFEGSLGLKVLKMEIHKNALYHLELDLPINHANRLDHFVLRYNP